MKAPNVFRLASLIQTTQQVGMRLPDGSIVPARPEGWYGIRPRFRAAWLVFTGRADAVIWPEGQ